MSQDLQPKIETIYMNLVRQTVEYAALIWNSLIREEKASFFERLKGDFRLKYPFCSLENIEVHPIAERIWPARHKIVENNCPFCLLHKLFHDW